VDALKRFWHWLRNPEYPVPGVPYETTLAIRRESYELGFAQGELKGRMDLARELELMFPPSNPMTAKDAANVKAKQVH
jgi:hypothetical protein